MRVSPPDRLLAIVCATSLCAAMLGCGASRTSSSSNNSTTSHKRATAAAEETGPTKRLNPKVNYDRDFDRDTYKHDPDEDNDAAYGHANSVNSFGPAAHGAQRRAIVATVERYRAATAAKDGNKACAELMADLVQGLAEQAPSGTPTASRCGVALNETIARLGRSTDAGEAKVRVIAVHVLHDKARVRVRLPTNQDRYVPLIRQGHAWKIETMFDLY